LAPRLINAEYRQIPAAPIPQDARAGVGLPVSIRYRFHSPHLACFYSGTYKEKGMSAQTFHGNVQIVWDDSVVLVFSFQGPGGQLFAGFVHQIFSFQLTAGTQTQVTSILQTLQQQAVQQALDPQTWVETLKTGARGTANPITVVFDDTINVIYTTATNQSFQLQQLFSVAG
jgi:hypothetical protein